MRPVERYVRIVARLTRPPRDRDRYTEETLADLAGSAELGLRRRVVIDGFTRAAMRAATLERKIMPKPIGPLAIAMRHRATAPRSVVLVAVASALALAVGIALAVS